MSRRLRAVRRASQLVFLAAFVVLLGLAIYPIRPRVPVDLFLRADPLIALSAMVSLRRLVFPLLWFALPVVVLTVLLGRVYCGWVCPMGTAIDVSERLFGIRGRRPAEAPPWRRAKFYLLIALLVTMLVPAAHRSPHELALSESVGLSAAYAVDPIALLTRTFTLAGVPALQWFVGTTSDTITAWSYSKLADRLPWLARALSPGQLVLSRVSRPVHFRLGVVTFAIFAGIVALGRLAPRFWCRNLCPLGALLGAIGRCSRLNLAVSEACTRCLRCVNECKTGAITEDPHHYLGTECIQCYKCIAVCPVEAISLSGGRREVGRSDEVRLDRRRVLGAAGLGIASVVLAKVDWGTRRPAQGLLKVSSVRLIRPPGSRAENEFLAACVRCGKCMKVCPTNGLQPALGEGGLEALGTPILVPRIGPCAEHCQACGQVCPTRAIEPFTGEEKPHLYLGTAVVDRSACIAWAAGRLCLVCDEACSYRAITQTTVRGQQAPVVQEEICVGCGVCEWVCPVQPRGAIHVSAGGDRRHWTREEQRLRRELAGPPPGGQETGAESPYPAW